MSVLPALLSAAFSLMPINYVQELSDTAGWQIFKMDIPSHFTGCTMARSLPNGNTVSFGRPTISSSFVQLDIYDKSWSSLTEGREYPVSVTITGKATVMSGTGHSGEGGPFLRIVLPYPAFNKIFNWRYTERWIEVTSGSTKLLSYAPNNHEGDALEALDKCYASFTDPFAH